jgi:hypothetical protein
MNTTANKWVEWKDGTYRCTSINDVLHLMVWHVDSGPLPPGWHYRVISQNHLTLRYSSKASPTREEARERCQQAALKLLNDVRKGLEAAAV